MLKTLKKVVVIILATLGVLFIALMLMPDDEETDDTVETVAEQDDAETDVTEEADVPEDVQEDEAATEESVVTDNSATEESSEDAASDQEEAQTTDDSTGNTVTVSIPDSEIPDRVLNFKTVSLDGDVVTQDIFADYDITVVHIWGTFCGPCIAEMGDYASFYKELPDNVNLVGLICDVYDGIDSNVSDANDILGDAGAEFLNMRTSDDLYDVTGSIQYVPSSFFVDREGHIIGEIMDGANFEMTKERLAGYLN